MQINFITAAYLHIYSCIISLILHILNPNVVTHLLDQRKPGCEHRHSGRSYYSAVHRGERIRDNAVKEG